MQWNQNKHALLQIIGEIVTETVQSNVQVDTVNQYVARLIDSLHSKQYDFKNLTELNKYVMQQTHEKIGELPTLTPTNNQSGVSINNTVLHASTRQEIKKLML